MPDGPPAASALRALDDDAWARVVGHARRVLRGLDPDRRAELADVDGLSAVALLDGDGRQALMVHLAAGGPLWAGVADRLADEDDDWDAWLDAPGPEPEPGPVAPAGSETPDARAVRAKERVRELTEQRDAAQRRATGAEARARAVGAELAAATEELARARDRMAGLQQQVASAGDAQEAALDRLRRRHESEIAALREEVRALRRAEDERRAEERRQVEAEAAAQKAEEEARRTARREATTGRQGAAAGRPSRLPRGIQPGTVAAAQALLTPRHRVLVDGYNVTLNHRGHLDLEQQRASLIALLEAAAARFRADFRVLFDSRHGSPPAPQRSRVVSVRFTEPGVTADDEIVFEVEAAAEDQPLLIVTDDRELRDRVRPYAVDVLRTGEFLRAVE